MNSRLFQVHKVRRLILTQGEQFEFIRRDQNAFDEPNEVVQAITLRGVYHETVSFISKTSTDATTLRKKASPMILCLWEDAKQLKHTDVLEFKSKTYKIGGIKDLSEDGLICDISLEEVQTDG